MSADYYRVLGVAPSAPPEVIRAAYRALMQKHHPDRQRDSSAGAVTAAINEAFRVLSDPDKRRAYDAVRQLGARPPHCGGAVALSARSVPAVAAGHAFSVYFLPGSVMATDVWSDTQVSSKGGGGLTVMGFGYTSAPRVTSQVVHRQRIGVRCPAGDLFLERTGQSIPIAIGQAVEIVRAESKDRSRDGFVAVINRSSGRWYWLSDMQSAGAVIRSRLASVRDTLLYFGIVALLSYLFRTYAVG
jgi:curved DNA-binding protein CbpA